MQDTCEEQCFLLRSLPGEQGFVNSVSQLNFSLRPILLPPLSLHRCWSLINTLHPKLLHHINCLHAIQPTTYVYFVSQTDRKPNHQLPVSLDVPSSCYNQFPTTDYASQVRNGLFPAGTGKFERLANQRLLALLTSDQKVSSWGQVELDYGENRWTPGKSPLVMVYHDQLLLVVFNHYSFAVLETVLEKLNKLFTVTNFITDAWNSFISQKSSSFHPQKVGLKPPSTSGDGKFREYRACVFHLAWPRALQAQACLTSANEDPFFWSGSMCWCLPGRIQFLLLLNGSSSSLNYQKFHMKPYFEDKPHGIQTKNCGLALWQIFQYLNFTLRCSSIVLSFPMNNLWFGFGLSVVF